MDPNAVHKAKTKHDHEHKRAAVTNQWQRHTRDGEQSNRHPHVLEDMREDERRDPDNQKESQLIASEESNKETRHQK
jgi:hypothetical protein